MRNFLLFSLGVFSSAIFVAQEGASLLNRMPFGYGIISLSLAIIFFASFLFFKLREQHRKRFQEKKTSESAA
jgi:hypothetical protein